MTGLIIFTIVLVVIAIVVVIGTALLLESGIMGGIAAIICILTFGGLIWWNWGTTYQNDHWATCTVTGKDRGADDGSYRVYTSDCGQLANEDSLLRNKHNSADYWQKIPDEGVVELRIVGFRAGFFSQFPNIFDVRAAESGS